MNWADRRLHCMLRGKTPSLFATVVTSRIANLKNRLNRIANVRSCDVRHLLRSGGQYHILIVTVAVTADSAKADVETIIRETMQSPEYFASPAEFVTNVTDGTS